MKSVVIFTIISLVILSCIAYAKDFSDVPSDHWAYQYINDLSNNGVINGYEDGTYKPQDSVTRAEFLKLLVSSESILKEEAMEYIKRIGQVNWYDPFVKYVMYREMSSREYQEEEYSQPIERVEIITFIKHFSKYYDMSVFEKNVDEVDEFNDVDDLNDFEKESLVNVQRLGVMNGYEDGSFKPHNNVTRAEVSAIIYRWNNALKREGFNL